MFIRFRYHIASIVSIFIALGLGILIGSAFPEDVAMVSQQSQLVSKLEANIYSLRIKNQSLQSRINTLEMDNQIKVEFERQALPALVNDRLKNHNIAVIVATGKECPTDMIEALKHAGCQIKSISTVKYKKTLYNLPARGDGLIGEDQQLIWGKVIEEVCRAAVTGKNDLVNALTEEEAIKIEGEYDGKVTDLVIVAGRADRESIESETISRHTLQYLKERSVNVFAAEESNVPYSSMDYYHRLGISTVDNIDTVAGQVALVFAINSRPGQYGIKSTAKKLIPDLDYGVQNYAE